MVLHIDGSPSWLGTTRQIGTNDQFSLNIELPPNWTKTIASTLMHRYDLLRSICVIQFLQGNCSRSKGPNTYPSETSPAGMTITSGWIKI